MDTQINVILILAILLLLFGGRLFLLLAIYLHEFVEHLVGGAFGDMKGKRQYIEGVSLNRFVVLRHMEEEGKLIGKVVISLHFGIDSPLVRKIRLRHGYCFVVRTVLVASFFGLSHLH